MKLRKTVSKILSVRKLKKGKSSSKLTSDETEKNSLDRSSAALGEAESKRDNLNAGRTEGRPSVDKTNVSGVLRNSVGDVPRSASATQRTERTNVPDGVLRNSAGEVPLRTATQRRLTATPNDGRVSFSMEDNKYASHKVFKQGKLVRPASTFQMVPNALDIDSDQDDDSYNEEQGGEDGGEENERGMSMGNVTEDSSPPAQDGDFVDGSLDALLAAARKTKEDQPCAEDNSAANKETPKDDTEFVDGSLDALLAAAMKSKDKPNADDILGGTGNEEPRSENEDAANMPEQDSENFIDGSLEP